MTVRRRRAGSSKKKTPVYCEMTVHGFALDSIAQAPIVLLKDDGENNTLPIWLTTIESVAIAAELINRDAVAENGGLDLLVSLFSHLQVSVERIAIVGMNGDAFDARVMISRGDEELLIRVRPCEAIVLALKCSLPIMVDEEVLAGAATLEVSDGEGIVDAAAGRFIDFLESLDPKDMGKYPL